MLQYLELLQKVYEKGEDRGDRTGTGTRSLFGEQFKCDLNQGFPLLTTKKMFIKGIIHELLWFLSGSSNIKYLQENGVKIWDEWAKSDGEIGPGYGWQWVKWGKEYNSPIFTGKTGYDQIAEVIESLRTNPASRRHIVSAWNVADIPKMALPPCHVLFQFYVSRRDSSGKNQFLDCHMYQRSADIFLGVPFNIASYALLTMMIAQVTGNTAGRLTISFGDLHIYNNHFDQVRQQLDRVPSVEVPKMKIDPSITEIDDFRYDHFSLKNYDPQPAIKAPISV